MKKIITGVFIVLIFCSNSLAFSLPDVIRIGLSYGNNAVDSFTVYAPSGIMISDIGKMRGQVTISKSGSNKIKAESSSSFAVSAYLITSGIEYNASTPS